MIFQVFFWALTLVLFLSMIFRNLPVATGVLLFAAVALPRTVYSFGPGGDRGFPGITGQYISLSSLSVVLIFGMVGVLSSMPLLDWARHLVLPSAFLVFGYFMLWPQVAEVRSGIVHWLFALAAFVVGIWVSREINGDVRKLRIFAGAIAVTFTVQLVLILFQFVTLAVGDVRVGGTYGHPGILGKVFVVALAFILPFISSEDRRLRQLGNIAFFSGIAATAITLSRANILAVVIVVALWLVLRPRRHGAGRLFVPLLLTLAMLPFFGTLLERFLSDPEGGDRPLLLEAGLRMLAAHGGTGVGPNYYVNVARLTENIVFNTGYAVHNSFVLAAAELGIVGSLIVALPLLLVLVKSVMHFSDRDRAVADVSRTYLIVGVGIVSIGWTGWGLLQSPTLELIYFAAGFFYAQIQLRSGRRDDRVAEENSSRDNESELEEYSARPRAIPSYHYRASSYFKIMD